MSDNSFALAPVAGPVFSSKKKAGSGIAPIDAPIHGQVGWVRLDDRSFMSVYYYGKGDINTWLIPEDFEALKRLRSAQWLLTKGRLIIRRRKRDWHYFELHGGCYALH